MKKIIIGIILIFAAQMTQAQTIPLPQPLQLYIQTALAENPEVQATRAKWKNMDAHVTDAVSNLYPRLDFVSKYSTFQGGRIINIPNVGKFNTAALAVIPWDNEFDVTWPLLNYGVWEGMDISKAYRDASKAEVSAKELSVSYQVSEAYYSYAKAEELVGVRKNAETLAEENLKVAKALFANDKAPKNDVLRADVGVASAQGDVLSAQNMATLAKTNFNNILKRDHDAEISVPSMQDLTTLFSMSPELASNDSEVLRPITLPPLHDDEMQAFKNRPELQQLMLTGEALGATKKAAFSDYLPNIALFASYGWLENTPQFANTDHLLVGGAQLKWNLFSGFNTNAKMQEADAAIEELRFEGETAANAIILEIEDARVEKVNAMERLAIAKKLQASAEENYTITKAQYDNGMALLITMIDAQTTLANAKANLATTTYDVLIADAKYRKAIGVR